MGIGFYRAPPLVDAVVYTSYQLQMQLHLLDPLMTYIMLNMVILNYANNTVELLNILYSKE
jgi:uncharacterized membrane protein YcgQ (UPF0703/DUF1980 family)